MVFHLLNEQRDEKKTTFFPITHNFNWQSSNIEYRTFKHANIAFALIQV